MLEGYLYGNYEPSEEVVEAEDRVVEVAHKVLDSGGADEWMNILEGACKLHVALLEFGELDEEPEDQTQILWGNSAEEYFIEMYKAVFLSTFKHMDEEGVMEGYNGYEIDWKRTEFTKKQLRTLAKVEASKYRAIHEEIIRLHRLEIEE